jgi:hypothetical protein
LGRDPHLSGRFLSSEEGSKVMDPHATWRDMQNALKDEDWDLAIELAEALLTWLKRGGFPPVIVDKDLPYGWHRKLAEAGATFVINELRNGSGQVCDTLATERSFRCAVAFSFW